MRPWMPPQLVASYLALAARCSGTAARRTGQTGPLPPFDDLPGLCPPPRGTHRPGMGERHLHDGARLRPTSLTTRVPSTLSGRHPGPDLRPSLAEVVGRGGRRALWSPALDPRGPERRVDQAASPCGRCPAAYGALDRLPRVLPYCVPASQDAVEHTPRGPGRATSPRPGVMLVLLPCCSCSPANLVIRCNRCRVVGGWAPDCAGIVQALC